jgi:putative membrane protein
VHPVAVAAAIVAALIHVWFFAMESLWFMRPAIHGRFGLSSEADARVVRSWAFNQGFYNLFLAVGVAIGLGLVASDNGDAGRALVLFACGSMVAAGAVLVLHDARFLRAAAVQFVPPLVAILAVLLLG